MAGVADRLPIEDESVDAVAYSLALCSVPDLTRALRERHRALKPGGELRFPEHVASESAGLRRTQSCSTPQSGRPFELDVIAPAIPRRQLQAPASPSRFL